MKKILLSLLAIFSVGLFTPTQAADNEPTNTVGQQTPQQTPQQTNSLAFASILGTAKNQVKTLIKAGNATADTITPILENLTTQKDHYMANGGLQEFSINSYNQFFNPTSTDYNPSLEFGHEVTQKPDLSAKLQTYKAALTQAQTALQANPSAPLQPQATPANDTASTPESTNSTLIHETDQAIGTAAPTNNQSVLSNSTLLDQINAHQAGQQQPEQPATDEETDDTASEASTEMGSGIFDGERSTSTDSSDTESSNSTSNSGINVGSLDDLDEELFGRKLPKTTAPSADPRNTSDYEDDFDSESDASDDDEFDNLSPEDIAATQARLNKALADDTDSDQTPISFIDPFAPEVIDQEKADLESFLGSHSAITKQASDDSGDNSADDNSDANSSINTGDYDDTNTKVFQLLLGFAQQGQFNDANGFNEEKLTNLLRQSDDTLPEAQMAEIKLAAIQKAADDASKSVLDFTSDASSSVASSEDADLEDVSDNESEVTEGADAAINGNPDQDLSGFETESDEENNPNQAALPGSELNPINQDYIDQINADYNEATQTLERIRLIQAAEKEQEALDKSKPRLKPSAPTLEPISDEHFAHFISLAKSGLLNPEDDLATQLATLGVVATEAQLQQITAAIKKLPQEDPAEDTGNTSPTPLTAENLEKFAEELKKTKGTLKKPTLSTIEKEDDDDDSNLGTDMENNPYLNPTATSTTKESIDDFKPTLTTKDMNDLSDWLGEQTLENPITPTADDSEEDNSASVLNKPAILSDITAVTPEVYPSDTSAIVSDGGGEGETEIDETDELYQPGDIGNLADVADEADVANADGILTEENDPNIPVEPQASTDSSDSSLLGDDWDNSGIHNSQLNRMPEDLAPNLYRLFEVEPGHSDALAEVCRLNITRLERLEENTKGKHKQLPQAIRGKIKTALKIARIAQQAIADNIKQNADIPEINNNSIANYAAIWRQLIDNQITFKRETGANYR